MVIAVDTGNRLIKTAHAEPFSAGLICHYDAKPFVATDTLYYDGRYYTFSETQGERRQDKSVDDYYYMLTLAAIAREIVVKRAEEAAGGKPVVCADAIRAARRAKAHYTEDIVLSVGLPPRDMVSPIKVDGKSMVDRYKDYFFKGGRHVHYVYDDISFDVTITDVVVSAQGFAAIFPNDIFARVTKYPQAFIIDIGGYTTDIALVANRRIDLHYFVSLDYGVIYLCKEVADTVKRRHGKDISGVLVEAVLRGESVGDDGVEATVREAAEAYAKRLVDALIDRKVDLSLSLPVLVGGGALLLADPLRRIIGRNDMIVVQDIRANAIGYDVFANRVLKERKKSAT